MNIKRLNFFHIEGSYQTCNGCNNMHDDGGLLSGMFYCHDCLDEIEGVKGNEENSDGHITKNDV